MANKSANVPARGRVRERNSETGTVPFNHLEPPAINNETPIPSQPIPIDKTTVVIDADVIPNFGAPTIPAEPLEVNVMWPPDANPVVLQGTRPVPKKRSHKKKLTK